MLTGLVFKGLIEGVLFLLRTPTGHPLVLGEFELHSHLHMLVGIRVGMEELAELYRSCSYPGCRHQVTDCSNRESSWRNFTDHAPIQAAATRTVDHHGDVGFRMYGYVRFVCPAGRRKQYQAANSKDKKVIGFVFHTCRSNFPRKYEKKLTYTNV